MPEPRRQRRRARSFLVLAFVAGLLFKFAVDNTNHNVFVQDSGAWFRQSKDAFLAASSSGSSSSGCPLEDEACLLSTAQKLARTWSQYHLDDNWWCKEKGKLWLVKVPKSASSTFAGLALRIGSRHEKFCKREGSDEGDPEEVFSSVRWEHGSARDQNLTQVLKGNDKNSHPAFLMAPIRSPESRALSDIYFHRVSLQQRRQTTTRQPADSFVERALQQVQRNYISEYVQFDTPPNPATSTNTTSSASIRVVESILQSYDFLFLVEDMTTSLVVFAWLTGLPVEDLLVTSSKTSGGWYSQKKRCVRLVPPVRTPAVSAYLESDAWKQNHATDRLLHAAVQLSMENTIQHKIGRSKVDQAVGKLARLQKVVVEACANETHAPCSPGGQLQRELAKQSCLLRDFGCGHRCFDRVLSQMSLPPEYLWR